MRQHYSSSTHRYGTYTAIGRANATLSDYNFREVEYNLCNSTGTVSDKKKALLLLQTDLLFPHVWSKTF